MGRNNNPREENAIRKQLLRVVFGENYVNIYAKTALQSTPSCVRAAPASAHRQPHSWINSLKSRCANFLYLIMMIPNYAKAVAMSFPRMTLNFVLLKRTHNLLWTWRLLSRSVHEILICLLSSTEDNGSHECRSHFLIRYSQAHRGKTERKCAEHCGHST